MSEIVNILLTTIAPILLVAGLGAVLDKSFPIDSRTLSRIVIYLGSPSLAFYSLSNSTITTYELGSILAFVMLLMAGITGLAWLVSRWGRMDRLTGSAFVLSAALINGINYGVPLNQFAFGQPGLERAVLIGVIFALYAYTGGVFLASWGKAPVSTAFTNVFKVPLPYAAVLGLLANFTQTPIPAVFLRITQILGNLAVPLMLLLLGINISRASLQGRWKVMSGASLLRLLGGASLGFVLALWLGLEGVTRQTAIVEAAMPTAVVAGVLATEFNSDARLVSSVVVLSTILSILTLPIVIALVG